MLIHNSPSKARQADQRADLSVPHEQGQRAGEDEEVLKCDWAPIELCPSGGTCVDANRTTAMTAARAPPADP